MSPRHTGLEDIPTQIKNPDLVEQRRRQIADAAVQLFVRQGFHKTTTRQIAKAAGVSIGSLYEYFACKEDVLYLVCHAIHSEVERGVSAALARASGGSEALAAVIREYFRVCHRMSDFILLIYQETRSLPTQWQKRVLENELRIAGLFVQVLAKLSGSGDIPKLNERFMELAAHDISVLGHMWTFRRWYLSRHFTLDEYIELQTEFILGRIEANPAAGREASGNKETTAPHKERP
ncbi:MAG: TetR/AcrR family transcriptional regulator [Desulfobacteraceae bacterium]|jgi:AcrR family transcriptional regulator|nr:TetR/AcrR family transcriptional regulator [Desulfobacteraceae bacterium]